MRFAFTTLVAALLLTALAAPLPAAEKADAASDDKSAKDNAAPPPIKALLITGGCCHDYPKQKFILAHNISKHARVEWKVVHANTTKRDVKVDIYKEKDWAKGYDVVVHNECFGSVDDVPFVEGIAKAHADGVGAVIIHCSVHSYRAAKTDEWRKMLGVTSTSHEKHRPVTVKTLKADHPIMKGFPKEWTTPNGELYKIEKLWPNTTPLAQAYGQDTKKDHVCIWTNQYGKGRVFGTTLGHHNETMSHENYIGLVTRGLLWAAGKLGDDGKPLKGYEATGDEEEAKRGAASDGALNEDTTNAEVTANAAATPDRAAATATDAAAPQYITRTFRGRQIIIGVAPNGQVATASPTTPCNCGDPALGRHRSTTHVSAPFQEQRQRADLR